MQVSVRNLGGGILVLMGLFVYLVTESKNT